MCWLWGGEFSIDVIALAPVGTVSAVDFSVTWSPAYSIDFTGVSPGAFMPGAVVNGNGGLGLGELEVISFRASPLPKHSSIGIR